MMLSIQYPGISAWTLECLWGFKKNAIFALVEILEASQSGGVKATLVKAG